jgi:hypothetical protein
MSAQAARAAVLTLLTSDSELDALLARDPNDAEGDAPALLWDRANADPPVYPCLTYRIDSSVPDRRFRPEVGGGGAKVEDVYFAFTAWSRDPDSAPLDAIAARLDALLENAALDLSDGARVVRSERVNSSPDHWDEKLNAWFTLSRYRLRVSHPDA